MPHKDLIAALLIPIAMGITTWGFCAWPRLRYPGFFILAVGLVFSPVLDVNMLSQEWYRGTTRGFEFSFVDVLAMGILTASVLKPLPGHRQWYWPGTLGWLLAFALLGLISVAIAQPKAPGLFESTKMLRGLVCFLAAALFVQSERELRWLLWALVTSLLIQGAMACYQRYGLGLFRVLGGLEHPNSLSMYVLMLAPVMVAAITSRVTLALQIAAVAALLAAGVSVVLTASRAGLPAFALVVLGATLACTSWRITRRKVLVGTAVLVVLVGAIVQSWDTLASRYREATLEEEFLNQNTEGRGQYFRLAKAIVSDHWMGVGLNNWSYWVSKQYGPAQGFPYEDYDDIPQSMLESDTVYDWAYKYAPPAHNLLAITAGELGLPGVLVFMVLWLRWLGMGWPFVRLRSAALVDRIPVGILFGIVGVALQSMTEWVFRQTAILLTFHLLVGALASLHFLRRRLGTAAQPVTSNPLPDDVPGLRTYPVNGQLEEV